MVKLEYTLNGDFYSIIRTLSDGIINGSMSATLKDSSDFVSGDCCSYSDAKEKKGLML